MEVVLQKPKKAVTTRFVLKIMAEAGIFFAVVGVLIFNYDNIYSSVFSKSTVQATSLPEGFEMVTSDGESHFMLVDEKHWGDRLQQRMVGAKVCSSMFKDNNYCEVYYFANKEDIPATFPIVNRLYPIGVFEMKYGHKSLKTLTGNDGASRGTVTFLKDRASISEAYQGPAKAKKPD